MTMLNADAQFHNSKRKSKAYKEYPKNVRQFLNIDNIHPNGIFKIESGNERCMYDRCYVFEDINYINKDTENKETILLLIMGWLNSMKTQFKITLANENRDLEKFLQEMLLEPNKEEYPLIKEGIDEWVQEKLEKGSPNIKQMKYLTVTCHSRNFEDAQIYFNMLEEQLERLFLGWKSHIYRIDAKKRLQCLHAFFRMGKEETFDYNPQDTKTDWRNNILPVSITQFSNFLILDNLYVSILFGYKYANSIDEGKLLSNLSHVSFPSMVTLDYAPIETQTLKGKIENTHMNNETAITNEMERKQRMGNYGSGISYQKKKKKEELEAYQEQIDENDECGFFIGTLVVVSADSEELLAQRIEHMQALGRENGATLEICQQRQLKALNTALPFGGRQVDHMRAFLTSSAVALQPYYAQDVQERGGNCYGLNRTTKRLISGNRKRLKNPHGIIVGHTGSGKSMGIKIELAQDLLRTDDDAIILDPQDEFKEFVQKIGGTFYELAAHNKLYLNPLEISREVFEGDSTLQRMFIASQSKYIKAFMGAIMTNILITQEHYTIIDRCIRKMYADLFAQKKLKKQATLKVFRNDYLRKEKECVEDAQEAIYIREMYNSMEEYTEGIYDLFSNPTNIDIHHRLVAFGLKKVPEEHWEPVMITIMQFLANRMEYNQALRKATRFIVDETQVVCRKPTSAATLLKAVVTFRKFGGICTLAFQNLSRILGNEDLRDMFSNCEYKCFLDQGGIDANELATIQELSSREFQALASKQAGQGVMVWGEKVILFDAFMKDSNALYGVISTDYHEKAEIYKLEEKERNEREEREQEKESIEQETNIEEVLQEKQKYCKEKAKIYEIIALTSVSIKEIETLVSLDVNIINQVMEELERERKVKSIMLAGVKQYSKVG